MKITKQQLKQLIKEELKTVLKEQNPSQADVQRATYEKERVDKAAMEAAKAARSAKYGGRSTPSASRSKPTDIIIDMLTNLTDMVEALQKP